QHLVADDLDDRLRGGEALQHVLFHRPVTNPVDKGLDDLEVDVGFEQREPNLTQRGLDVLRRKPSLTSQRLEDILEACAQGVEHAALNLSTVNHYRNGRVGSSQCGPAKSTNTVVTDTTGGTRFFLQKAPCVSVLLRDLRVGALRQKTACVPAFPS